MAIGTTSAGPGVPVTLPVIDLATGAPGERAAVAALKDALERVEHRARTRGGDRDAVPFFMSPRVDHVIECPPTCQGPDDPPRYESITHGEYVAWSTGQNYHGEADAPPSR